MRVSNENITSHCNLPPLLLFVSDLYVTIVSNLNQVAPKDYYLGFVSTKVESANPEQELKAGLDILQPIEERFVSVKDIFEPTDDGKESQVSA